MNLIYKKEELSQKIRIKRIIELNISTREAAEQIGIGYATLSRIENKKTPDIYSLAKVCKWVGVTVDELFEFVDAKKKKK